jgi:osmotically-inducible protein OsmY
MKTDAQLKTDVTEELFWDPVINSAHISVIVKAGIRGIALELDVKLASTHKRSDTEIAKAVTFALYWNSLVPDDLVKVEVEDDCVTLTGELAWRY